MRTIIISRKAAGILSLFLLLGFIVFHFLVIFDVLPRDMAWGDGPADPERAEKSFYVVEAMVILVIIAMGAVLAIRAGLTSAPSDQLVLRILTWGLAVFFLLNVIVNITSDSWADRVISIAAILLAYCSYRLALPENQDQ